VAPPAGSGRPFFYAETAGFWVLLLATCVVAGFSAILDPYSRTLALLAKLPLWAMLPLMIVAVRTGPRPSPWFGLAIILIIVVNYPIRKYGGFGGSPAWVEVIAQVGLWTIWSLGVYARFQSWSRPVIMPALFEYEDWKTKKGPLD